jgi:hypothetical protein
MYWEFAQLVAREHFILFLTSDNIILTFSFGIIHNSSIHENAPPPGLTHHTIIIARPPAQKNENRLF